jgi:hypothetical protein
MVSDWDFPYWDSSVHSDAMMFHYNNTKVTEANGQGMLAVVWQNSWRARQYNEYSKPITLPMPIPRRSASLYLPTMANLE